MAPARAWVTERQTALLLPPLRSPTARICRAVGHMSRRRGPASAQLHDPHNCRQQDNGPRPSPDAGRSPSECLGRVALPGTTSSYPARRAAGAWARRIVASVASERRRERYPDRWPRADSALGRGGRSRRCPGTTPSVLTVGCLASATTCHGAGERDQRWL